MFIPCTTRVRTSRVANIGSDRLTRRHQHLLDELVVRGGERLAQRNVFVRKAVEMHVIENELVNRGHVTTLQLHNMRDHARGFRRV